MALWPIGVSGFDSAVLVAERAWQASRDAGWSTQALATAATKTYLQAVVNAGIANNVATPTQLQALLAIQTTGNP
jgi:hypothetical protein